MGDQVYVKPCMIDGVLAVVRHPSYVGGRERIPQEGAYVTNDTTTRKRIKEGGLVIAQPPYIDEVPPPAPPPAPVEETAAVDENDD